MLISCDVCALQMSLKLSHLFFTLHCYHTVIIPKL